MVRNDLAAMHTAAKLASFMLGDQAATHRVMIADALGKVCNMVAGNFKAKITTVASRCMLSTPTVISGGDYFMHTPAAIRMPAQRLIMKVV